MNTPPTQIATITLALAACGAIVLVIATALALRPRRAAHSFRWIVIAAFANAILALAAASHMPASGGLQAAALHLIAVLLAAALGAAAPARADASPEPSPSALPAAARGLSWLTLLGIPPTAGFHGRILVSRALLLAGWEWLAVLAMVGGAAALLPAFWAFRSPRPAALRGWRAALVILLAAAILALGLYPESGLAIARLAENLPVRGGLGLQ